MREVPTIILPSLGSRFYQVVRDIGVAGYVSPYVTKLGVRQADEQLGRLRQQGIVALV